MADSSRIIKRSQRTTPIHVVLDAPGACRVATPTLTHSASEAATERCESVCLTQWSRSTVAGQDLGRRDREHVWLDA